MQFVVLIVYRSDMPRRLPVSDVVGGVSNNALRNAKQWAHLGFVAFIWLLLVPVCVCKCDQLLLYVFVYINMFG